MHQTAVFGLVRVPLRPVAENLRVLFVRHDLHDAVCRHRVFVEHERDDVAGFQFRVRDGLDVDQTPRVIRRFHRAGQNRIHLQSDQPHAHQGDRQQNRERDDQVCDGIPNLEKCGFHNFNLRHPCMRRAHKQNGTQVGNGIRDTTILRVFADADF